MGELWHRISLHRNTSGTVRFTVIALIASMGSGIAAGCSPRGNDALSPETLPEHPEIRRAYAQDKADWSPLHIAVLYDDKDEIRRLVRENADLDATVPGSLWTPLDVAALYDKAETLAFLVEAWERARDAAYDYDRSLFLAVIHGNANAARYLLERGGDPDTKSFDFEPQLRVAATHAHQAVMKVLLEYDVDVAATTASGLTALHGAAERGPEGVELLLRHGANVQVRANNGTTPLHVAARHGQTEGAAVLLAAGADPSSRTVSGKTPLDLARDRGHVSTLQLLEGAVRAP